MPFLEKTSKNFNSEFLDHLDEVLVLPHPSPLQYSEIARIQLRKLIPEMLSPMRKKVMVYLSQAALLLDIGALMDNGGHAAKEWLETKIGPELQKSWGDGIEGLSVVYVDVLVGTFQLSCRVENIGHFNGKFRKTLMNLRKMHYRNKRHVKMIHKLGIYAHDVPYNAELMVRIIDEMLKEAFDFKQMLGNLDFSDWEEECQQQMRIQKKAEHNYMNNFSKFCYKFVESNKTTQIIQALLESMRDVPPVKEHFQRPHSFLFLGLHRAGREDLAAGLSKCYAPESSMSSVVEVDLPLCTEPDSFFRCTCKGKPGDLFVDAMRARSRSIIVFYDFEIAHISVFSNILSILDHGFLSDNKGDDIYFHNSIVICVSRCGNREMISALFRVLDDDRIDDATEGLRFRTEFLNRLDEIVLFFPFRRQQFDVGERLPVSGLPVERRKEFSIMIHSLFHSGKMSSAWCLWRMLTKLKAG
ncbi:uncharacterized protein [Primulina huaijiensis]|uniref:uncharacterized protein isoform X2 n=1 Tax=Primulina huaijiensis TaxID=1492673 RepID=UPI003CC76372